MWAFLKIVPMITYSNGGIWVMGVAGGRGPKFLCIHNDWFCGIPMRLPRVHLGLNKKVVFVRR